VDVNPAILIPARWASTRFPGKMVTDLRGKSLIRRVYESCLETDIPTYVITDSMKIQNEIGENALIEPEGENGTDRLCAWVNKSSIALGFDTYINVQGDMPDIKPRHIRQVLELLQKSRVATLYTDFKSEEDKENPNVVKVVHTGKRAVWFGRGITGYGHHHLGIYGYHHNELRQYRFLKRHDPEIKESLEQIRWLMNGVEISVAKTKYTGIEINTPEDVLKWDEDVPLHL
jgi:3-deoxy-manno-octulosonate cytidylyltransferase (CMP-KDO synthetase)